MRANIIKHRTTSFIVGVFWLSSGSYGGGTTFATLTEAMDYGERLKKLGYGKPEKSEIHIRKVTQTTMRLEESDGTRAHSTIF